MGLVAFALKATLGLDSSEYEKGLGEAKSKASSIGSTIGKGLATIGKTTVAAVSAASAVVGKFAVDSVQAGGVFDKSMSQVAATMGMTVADLQDSTSEASQNYEKLREFAQEMGRTTAFSASQAADALNYMALAGYDVETSMSMLPNVLNLAASGNMELARASDMVTDAATAFGLTLEDGSVDIQRTTQMVDEMAKAASTGNTSVEQLGDAFLVVGGLAQEMNGGMVELADGTMATYDNIQELEIALTAMANAGIKGGEAGTHLRNMLLKLASPTDDGVAQFEALGVSVFDSEGKMRSLSDIMGELSTSMGNLTQEEKLQAISDIFNTRDTAAAEALLQAVGGDWDHIAQSILDADGAAQAMADTQLNNLTGDMTLFKSALEGAQIAVSDQLTPALRDFVRFGTDGLSTLTSAFKEGGLTGAMEAFGTILSDGLNMIIGKLPDFINAGMQLLGALGQGLLNNLPTIVDAAVQIVVQLSQGLVQALPELAKGAITLIQSLAQSFSENKDSLLQVGSDLLTMLWEGITEGLPMLVEGAVDVIGSLSQGITDNLPQMLETGLNALMEFSGSLRENAGLLIDAGLDMIVAIAEGLIEALPVMIETIPTIVTNIAGIINDNAPKLIATGIELIGKLVAGIIQAIPTLIAEFPKIIQAIFAVITAVNWINLGATIINGIVNGVKGLAANLPNALKDIGTKGVNFLKNIDWRNLGSQIINFITNGIKSLVSNIPNALKSIGSSAMSAFKSINWLSLGTNIIAGIVSGITSGVSNIINAAKNAAQSAFNAAKSVLGISSPSKKFRWIGEMVDKGFAKGVDDNAGLVDDAISNLSDYNLSDITGAMGTVNASSGPTTSTSNSVVINVYGAVGQAVDELADIVADKVNHATRQQLMAWS